MMSENRANGAKNGRKSKRPPDLRRPQRRSLREEAIDVLERLAHELFAAHMADKAGGDERAVVAALFGLLGGQIALGAVGQLDEEGLLGIGARLDLVAVVEEELERVGGDGDGAEADDVALGVEDVHLFLQFLAAEDTEVDLQRSCVVEIDIARLFGQIVMDAAARSGDLRKGRAAQRQLHVVDLMHELGVCLRCVKAFIVDLNDLICDALACLAHAGEVKHGGVCLSGVRVGALEVRVVHVAFRLDPADEIDRALVAGGRAERKHKEFVAEMLAQEHLGLAPEVGGDEQPVLDALRRALEQADGLDLVFQHHITPTSGKYIVFCANKEHMDEMVSHVPEWFAGVNPDVVVYEAYSDDPNTDKAFADFKTDTTNRLKLLFCIDMLNEGVHVEGISGVILFRPTISPIIYKQQIGRALTAGDTAAPLILDVVNNFEGLTSISGLQSEMQEAVHRLYANGEGDKIVTERFEVIEQVHDCRVLFEQLQASLSSSWEHYFSEASIYYAEYGNLNVPKLYTTPGGLSLGVWLVTQRRVREGQIQGNLTEQQIARLDSIGMVWGNRKEIAWQHGFEVAKKYHDTYGNLMVARKYVDPDGYPLGQWILKTRQQKLNGRLKEERISQLDELGMVWSVFDAKWEKAYALAAVYYEENGNLNIPRSYVTAAGERLGQWVASQQWAYPKGKLTDEQVERLNRIGMYWGNRNDRQWNEGYQEAKRYFDAHGDLNVPADYVSPGGYNLGNWVKRQRYTRQNPEKSCAVLTEERIAKLDAIGMRWEKADSRLRRLEPAQESKRKSENLNVSANHKTGEEIGLCS